MWDPPSTLLVNLHQNECRYMQYIVKSFLDSDFSLSMQKNTTLTTVQKKWKLLSQKLADHFWIWIWLKTLRQFVIFGSQFHPMVLKCFALIHISKRNKTLQGHWTEWPKEQKITNGWSLCNYFIIFTLVVNVVLHMFILNAYPVWILNGL